MANQSLTEKIVPEGIKWRLKSARNFINTFDKDLFYYHQMLAPKIFKSSPIICDLKSSYEIHILTSQSDLMYAMWCLKTYYCYSAQRPMLVIHEDGSFTDVEKELCVSHFKNCRIVQREQADREVNEHLNDYPVCKKFRNRKEYFYFGIKLFDFTYYAEKKNLLILDSDLLFFNKPTEVIDLIEANIYFYMDNIIDDGSFSVDVLRDNFQWDVFENFNSGLMFIPSSIEDLNFTEEYLAKCEQEKAYHLYEQTGHMLRMAKHCPEARMLSNLYSLGKNPVNDNTILHHFVNDGYRREKYVEGFKQIVKNNFLKVQKRLAK